MLTRSSIHTLRWEVQLRGTIDASSVHRLERALDLARRRDVQELVIDLRAVSFEGVTGLEMIVDAGHRLSVLGGGLQLTGMPPELGRAFDRIHSARCPDRSCELAWCWRPASAA